MIGDPAAPDMTTGTALVFSASKEDFRCPTCKRESVPLSLEDEDDDDDVNPEGGPSDEIDVFIDVASDAGGVAGMFFFVLGCLSLFCIFFFIRRFESSLDAIYFKYVFKSPSEKNIPDFARCSFKVFTFFGLTLLQWCIRKLSQYSLIKVYVYIYKSKKKCGYSVVLVS